MATNDHDLSALKIDRSGSGGFARKSKIPRRFLFWTTIALVVGAAFFLWREKFAARVEVQLATVSFTTPAQAEAVLTASGYVVARRKAAVASKGTEIGRASCRERV